MARSSSNKDSRSKIRFVLLEADIESGDFSEITQAIKGALGPKNVVLAQLPDGVSEEEKSQIIDSLDVEPEIFDDETQEQPRPKKARSATKRSFPTPEVVDVDWAVEPSIEDFTAQHPPSKEVEKYLVIIAWFKEAASIQAVSANQVYTAFRKLKWSTAKKDFSQPLRDLKSNQLTTGNAKDGFSINHLGLARVEELK